MQHFNDREFAEKHGPIRKIVLRAGDIIDGFEIWYGNESSGYRGGKGGIDRVLEVLPHESIAAVFGYMGQYLVTMRFDVSPDKWICGGNQRYKNGWKNFVMGYPDSGPSDGKQNGRLLYVYGWHNTNGHIE